MEFEIKDGLKVKINEANNTASIIKSSKATGKVFIPHFFEKGNVKYKIIAISKNAFENCNIESLTFPEDSEVEIFESSCFFNAQINILQIPSSVKTIDGCFNIIQDLKVIELSPNNQHFKFHNNQYLLGKSDESVDKFDVLHFGMFDIEEAVIPSQVSIIKGYSFYKHKNVKTIKFEANSELKIIDSYAFSLTNIESIEFPSSVEVIGVDSFDGTSNLKSVKFPSDSNLKKIEKKAFVCSKLNSITLPASVEYLDDKCFILTPDLCEINVSPENKFFKLINGDYIVKESVKGSGVFDVIVIARRDLESITIPSCIKVINNSAFYNCKKLKDITFEPNSSLELIQDYVFCYFSAEKIVLPPSLKEVGVQSFFSNSSLKSAEFLGKSVQIKKNCFYNCRKIETIVFPNAEKIVFENSAMVLTPDNMKILVRKNAQLSGDGYEECKDNIYYIEEEEERLREERLRKEEESKRNEEKAKSVERVVSMSIEDDMPVLENLIDEVFNQSVLSDEALTDQTDESVQKKPYIDFLPTISFHFNKSIKDIDFSELQNLLGDDAVILNVDGISSTLQVSLLSVKSFEQEFQAKLEEYVSEMMKVS